MRIALVISSFRSGGAERVATVLSNHWSQNGHHIFVLTLAGRDLPPFYPLDPAVSLVPLDLAGTAANPIEGLANNLHRAIVIRRELSAIRPDAVISFMDTTNVLAVLSSLGLGVPVLVADRNNPIQRRVGRFWRPLRDLAYARAAAVVVQTRRAARCLPPSVEARSVVIPNPVRRPAKIAGEPEIRMPRPAIMAMGRLTYQKGFDLLIEAFARVVENHREWHLVIVGEGPDRSTLERQVVELGIGDSVRLPGRVQNPDAVLSNADLFVLSSRYEGFPNALLEAMACGLPVVSFDCPFGPAEIIKDGVDGVLVEPEKSSALADALNRLIADEALRRDLGAQAPAVIERFALEKVSARWEELLARVTAG